jgi:uncharacterized Zn-binding protein involved in type VI secretion
MPAVARGNGTDVVISQTGAGYRCNSPVQTATLGCSAKVFIDGAGVVRIGDIVAPHNRSGCSSIDTSVLTTGSNKIFIEGKAIGRIGDMYTSDNIITSGSSKVFLG